jgi:hypothetical protein
VAKRLAFQADREVRHTVIRVITAHLNGTAPVSWCGLNFDFVGAVFDGGDFSRAKFSSGTVSFAHSEFSRETVDFAGAKFSGGTADFSGAEFPGGTVRRRRVLRRDGRLQPGRELDAAPGLWLKFRYVPSTGRCHAADSYQPFT